MVGLSGQSQYWNGRAMEIERIWVGNSGRNFNYLVACAETGDALAVDPLDAEAVLAAADRRGWRISQIVNTHEHSDHTGGNTAVASATGATILAHEGNLRRIPKVSRGLRNGDEIAVGRGVRLKVLETPGHTLAHVCLFFGGDEPALFCGDTLFNAGAGNCHLGGHPERLYETFVNVLAPLPRKTRVFPGHDYLMRNLGFTLNLEPDNVRAKEILAAGNAHDSGQARVTTLAEEHAINIFFRLNEPQVIESLRVFSKLSAAPTPRDVFLAVRKYRNDW